MKNKFKIIENIAFILFFVVWTGVAIFFWFKIAGHIENKEIVKNGITLNAEVVDYDTNMSINKVNYYYMTYMFEIDGETFYGLKQLKLSFTMEKALKPIMTNQKI